ncbi:MAG: response regulator transcription factor [Actinobacteria bacterium]|nr:response regulator transcription factor [Actinomycetota bacterium]
MEPSSRAVRVAVVDDHEIVRHGLVSLLHDHDDIVVVGEAGNAKEALELTDRTKPDVVIMDVRLDRDSGIELTREIRDRRPATQVIMLTSYADDEALFASIMAGAAGYLLKQIRRLDLLKAVRNVARGQSLLDPAVTASVLDRLRRGNHLMKDEKLARLSPQEERVLALVADGRTNREIGEDLFISEKTVKNHLSHILAKLEVTRRAQAAAYLTRHEHR